MIQFSTLPPCDSECGNELRAMYATRGIDATVSHLKPLIATPFESIGMTCPHGVTWHSEPTSEQRAAWTRDRTP